ncbi:hypothetical protein NARC_130016 [Candidatus Nitrosocosmicus arcticus]|uniref:Uncharacterized protein n=1 Tax=Candidatus Nitrosocosmicus arcticus TaxID=2035267 RepID=A0A557SSU0_9ARCH|nr:hypothetical protein NARC_130016 [Candidatus Nitrosocosmicus arcticus]
MPRIWITLVLSRFVLKILGKHYPDLSKETMSPSGIRFKNTILIKYSH